MRVYIYIRNILKFGSHIILFLVIYPLLQILDTHSLTSLSITQSTSLSPSIFCFSTQLSSSTMRSFPKSVLLFTSATSLCLKGVQRPLQLCKGGGRQTWRKGTRNSQVRKGNVRMMMNKAMGNSISLDEDERINMVCIIIHSSYEKVS